MRSFGSDNHAPVHPDVLALESLVRPHQAVVCADTAHIHTDECGAPERHLGCKLLPAATVDGRLSVEAVDRQVWGVGDEHHVQARALSITQSTELGTRYPLAAVRELADWAHRRVVVAAEGLHAAPPGQDAKGSPVIRSYASRYRERVCSTISGGIGGGSPRRSQLDASQSRTNCLSYDGCGPPGAHRSAGHQRDESGVSTSSPRVSTPPASRPNSSLVSASRIPRSRAISAPWR